MLYEKAVEITENIVGDKNNIYWDCNDSSPVIEGFLFGSIKEVRDKTQIVNDMLCTIGLGTGKVSVKSEWFKRDFYRIAIYMDLNIISEDEFCYIAQLVKLFGKTHESVKRYF
jgi:hypothetical protein